MAGNNPRVTLNPALRRAVLDAVRPQLERKADAGLGFAQRVAPRDTGEYAAGLTKIRTSWGYRLLAAAPHSFWVEYGNRRQRGHRVLGRTIDVVKRS